MLILRISLYGGPPARETLSFRGGQSLTAALLCFQIQSCLNRQRIRQERRWKPTARSAQWAARAPTSDSARSRSPYSVALERSSRPNRAATTLESRWVFNRKLGHGATLPNSSTPTNRGPQEKRPPALTASPKSRRQARCRAARIVSMRHQTPPPWRHR